MKKVFYRALLGEVYRYNNTYEPKWETSSLTYNEKLLYSYFISQSLSIRDDTFQKDGSFNYFLLSDIEKGFENLSMPEYKAINLSYEFNMTEKSVYNSVYRLKELSLINGSNIMVWNGFFEKGYFTIIYPDFECIDIKCDIRLNNSDVIFYSFLKDRGRLYDGIIDTYKYRIAELLGFQKSTIKKIFNRLYKLNLIERLDDGRLLIK